MLKAVPNPCPDSLTAAGTVNWTLQLSKIILRIKRFERIS